MNSPKTRTATLVTYTHPSGCGMVRMVEKGKGTPFCSDCGRKMTKKVNEFKAQVLA